MINTTSPTTMTVGEVVTFPLVMNIPAMSVSNVIVDVSLPINGTAVAIVKDIRLISAGKNIKCLYENTTKNVVFHPVYNSSLDNCQNDKGYIDFGIVTNAGMYFFFYLDRPSVARHLTLCLTTYKNKLCTFFKFLMFVIMFSL